MYKVPALCPDFSICWYIFYRCVRDNERHQEDGNHYIKTGTSTKVNESPDLGLFPFLALFLGFG